MTGRENIYMNGSILGRTKSEIDSKMDSIIEFSELKDFIDTPVKHYSSGMFEKLAFSVAARLDSEIMIMDEVLAVGDMAFQKKCLARMREVADTEGRTVLYVSHNMNTIRELCDRCIVLNKGQIIFDGDVETAIQLYMDKSVERQAVDMDLSQKSHAGKGKEQDTGLRMEHLCLLDKLVPVYDGEEPLRLSLRLKVDRPLTNVRFRLTLRTDTDEAVGTAWSNAVDFPLQADVVEEVDAQHADMLDTINAPCTMENGVNCV